MSKYLADISGALLQVFETANKMRLEDNRLSGYAANIEFWADEMAHGLAALEGFESRQRKFDTTLKSNIEAQRDAVLQFTNPLQLRYGEATTTDQLQSYNTEVNNLHDALIAAGKTFFNKLHRAQLVDQQAWFMLEDRFPFLKKT